MIEFSRAEVERAFQHHDALTRRFAYHEAAQLYLEDGWAGNTVFGVFHGRPGIEKFFRHNPPDLGSPKPGQSSLARGGSDFPSSIRLELHAAVDDPVLPIHAPCP